MFENKSIFESVRESHPNESQRTTCRTSLRSSTATNPHNKLEPKVRRKLTNLELRSQQEFAKVYHMTKNFDKNKKRFYEPKEHKKLKADDTNYYTTEFLQSIGIVPESNDTSHCLDF